MDFVRPVALAISFTLFGELLIFLIWGVSLFPNGPLWTKAIWTATCGVAMGATIGAFVGLVVVGRLTGARAVFWTGALYFAVLAFCTILCFRIDLATGSRFGAREAPALFLAGGLVPALATSFLYAWLLTSDRGNRLLARLGV